jgi:hypothetical protein
MRRRRVGISDDPPSSLSEGFFVLTYYKPDKVPQLLGKNFPKRDDSRVQLTQAEFLSRAWLAANLTAHELGWIV